MNKIIIAFVLFFLPFAQTAGAATAAGSLVIEGRSIPENSIAVQTSFSGNVGQPFILDATKSQDDGLVGAYTWEQVSGPTVKLVGQNIANLSFTPTVAGTYVFDLVVTDATGLSTVSKKVQFIVDGTAPAVKATPPSPDPDFDQMKTSPTPVSAGDVNRDGVVDVVTTKVSPPPPPPSGLRGSDSGVSDTGSQTKPSITGGDRTRPTDDPVTLDGSISNDPDFDQLNISVGGDDLEKFRAEVSSGDTNKVTVRGWDPKKKEEIVGRPEDVKTSKDLKIYIEAVALNDPRIEFITVGKESLHVVSKEEGKLFWVIPVRMSSIVTVQYTLFDSSEDPASVSVKLPWWNVFVKKNYGAGELETELMEATEWEKIDNTDNPVAAISFALSTVSNVLKTKHDTVKNSIGNVR